MSETRTSPPEEEGRDVNNQRPVRPELTLHERPSFLFTAIRWLVLCGLIVGSLLIGLFVGREMGLLPGGAARGRGAEGATPEQIEKVTAEGTHQAQLALGKVKQRQALDQAGLISENVARCLEEAASLEARIAGLQADDEGKWIGSSPELVASYVAIVELKRPSRVDLDRLEGGIDGLRKPLASSLKDELDGTVPAREVVDELLQLERKAEEGLEAHRSAREQLDALASRARGEGTRGTVALEEAVAAYRREETRRETARLEEARTKARAEAAAKAAVADAENVKLLTEKEIALKKAQTLAEATKKEQERIKVLSEDPAILAKFQPLLAKGKWLFTGDEYALISGPASYTILLKEGYLKGYVPFARAMAGWTNYGRDDFNGNPSFFKGYSDRIRHKMPDTDEEWAEMKQLFEIFKEVAPIWVEKGLLQR
jgi:hypothetical protein